MESFLPLEGGSTTASVQPGNEINKLVSRPTETFTVDLHFGINIFLFCCHCFAQIKRSTRQWNGHREEANDYTQHKRILALCAPHHRMKTPANRSCTLKFSKYPLYLVKNCHGSAARPRFQQEKFSKTMEVCVYGFLLFSFSIVTRGHYGAVIRTVFIKFPVIFQKSQQSTIKNRRWHSVWWLCNIICNILLLPNRSIQMLIILPGKQKLQLGINSGKKQPKKWLARCRRPWVQKSRWAVCHTAEQ